MNPKKKATRVATKRKPTKVLPDGFAPQQVPGDAGGGPTLAMLYADEIKVSSRIATLSRELLEDGHSAEASVLHEIHDALLGDANAVAVVARMAKLVGPRRPKRQRAGHPPKTATQMFPKLVQRVALTRQEGAKGVRVAEQLICFFEKYLGPSPLAAALFADQSKLAKLVDADAEKFVKAVHRALGHKGTDNLGAAARMRRSRAARRKRADRALRRAS